MRSIPTVLALFFTVVVSVEYKGVTESSPIHILFPLPAIDLEQGGKNPFQLSINKVIPVVELAIEETYRRQYIPNGSIMATFRDTQLSDAHGPNVAISQLVKNELDCIIGYAFVYALAPVARMSPAWKDKDSDGIPVITSIGLTSNMDNKEGEYKLLTRISSPYKVVVSALEELFIQHEWKKHTYLFHHDRGPSSPAGECFLMMASIQNKMKTNLGNQEQHNFFHFNEHAGVNRSQLEGYLIQSSFISNGWFWKRLPETAVACKQLYL